MIDRLTLLAFWFGLRVVPTAGPWSGSPGIVVGVDEPDPIGVGRGPIDVRFDNEPRSPTGHGHYSPLWLRIEKDPT